MKKVVVVGGGFAGARTAKLLEDDFDVTLIDSKEYFEFTPGILRTIVDTTHLQKVQVLHSHYLTRGRFIRGHAQASTDTAVLVNEEELPFDYLVIATGSRYNLPFKEENVIAATRGETLRKEHERVEKAEHIAIVGGGIVGVELAAEICSFYPKKKITIVHSRDRLMERSSPKASEFARTWLTNRGVTIHFGEKMTSVTKGKIVTDKGKKFDADVVFLSTGIVPNSDGFQEWMADALSPSKQFIVNEYLQIKGRTTIFAAGDVTAIQEEKTAQNAEKQALVVAHNILAMEQKQGLKMYVSEPRVMDISLGPYAGILTYQDNTMTGLIPAAIKALVEWKTMRRYR